MIVYRNIKKTYKNKLILDIPELIFDEGNVYGLKGLNGSGKSTLCRILSKIEKADKKIIYPNISVGYMPQKHYTFDMNMMDNILLNVDKNDDKNLIISKINYYLEQFDLLKYKNKNAKELSGGEKQKLSLIRVLIKKYDFLILDEPTSNMDLHSMDIVRNEIQKYSKENNSTILMVSHEEGELEKITDNIIYLENGIIK